MIIVKPEINSELDYQQTRKLIRDKKLYKRLKEKYGERLLSKDWLEVLLSVSVTLFGKDLENKIILDLGCGSTGHSYDYERMQNEQYGNRDFQPWLPRALHLLGVKVIGIDYGKLDGEEFEHIGYSNLLNPLSLKSIPDKSIDLAHARQLYSSPQLEKMIDVPPSNYHDFAGYRTKKLESVLLPQLNRIVKPEGFYYHN